MAEENKSKSALLSMLNDLTKIESILLVLSFSLAANIRLVRGSHVSIFHEVWSTALQTIPLGDAVIFLCFFGIFMTAGMYALRQLLMLFCVEIYLWVAKKMSKFFPAAEKFTPSAHSGYVQRRHILEKANRESNTYYLNIYKEFQELDEAEWTVSSHALCAIVLLIMDWHWDKADSVAVYIWNFLYDGLSPRVAWLSALFIVCLLLRLFLEPVVGDKPYWKYCPGFPDLPAEDKLKVALKPPPPTLPRENTYRL